MKKILTNLKSKLPSFGKKKQLEAPVGRITTDTLAEHREQVLAGGRKFKYPIQYQRHKLVVNTIIIAVAVLVLLVSAGWYTLYMAQSTSEFMYRVTKVVPVPVASIDGTPVSYSNYLMKYRSAAHYLIEKEQIDERSDDGKRQLYYVKTQAMEDAISDAYASKLARQNNITVSDAELETFIKKQRQDSDISESAYYSVVEDNYGWSPEEYRSVIETKLIVQKVSYAIDSEAQTTANTITNKIKNGSTNLEEIANSLNDAQDADKVSYTSPTWVPSGNQDGGLAETAGNLEVNQISDAIKNTTGDGYYFVKLIEKNDTQVRYEYLKVPLTVFETKLSQASKGDSLKKYITIKDESEQ